MGIIDYLKNDENKSILCHYTTREAALEYILPSLEIRFSPLRKTNDPKENKEPIVGISFTIDVETEAKKDFNIVGEKFKKIVLDYSKVLCLTKPPDENPYNLNTKRAFGKPRMWSHYGNNHKGICLVFDEKKLTSSFNQKFEDESKELFVKEVIYDDYLKSLSLSANSFSYDRVKEIGMEPALIEHVKTHQNALYFIKDTDWESENEFRYIINKWGGKEYEFLNIEDSLTSVILGVDFPEVYLPSVQNLCFEMQVELLKLSWDSNYEDFELFPA